MKRRIKNKKKEVRKKEKGIIKKQEKVEQGKVSTHIRLNNLLRFVLRCEEGGEGHGSLHLDGKLVVVEQGVLDAVHCRHDVLLRLKLNLIKVLQDPAGLFGRSECVKTTMTTMTGRREFASPLMGQKN